MLARTAMAALAATLLAVSTPAQAATLTGDACLPSTSTRPACVGAAVELLRGGVGHLYLRAPTGPLTYRIRWQRSATGVAIQVNGVWSRLVLDRAGCASGTVTIGARQVELTVCR